MMAAINQAPTERVWQHCRPLRLSYRCSRFRAGDIRAWLADPLGWHKGKAIDATKGAVQRIAKPVEA